MAKKVRIKYALMNEQMCKKNEKTFAYMEKLLYLCTVNFYTQ